MRPVLVLLFAAIFLPVSVLSASDFTDAVASYESGNYSEAADIFKRMAASADLETSAAAYYNHGTILAELAAKSEDPASKRSFLEESFQSLKRASEIGALPAQQQKQARQNMEVVREHLSKLPEEQGEQSEQSEQSDGDSGEDSRDMLQKQQELSERTSNGEGSSQQLARDQQQLQQESEEAGLDDAAENQKKAAQALQEGKREEASAYQEAAERALAEASKSESADESGTDAADAEAEAILNQEAEDAAERGRLDKRGGISDAERNW